VEHDLVRQAIGQLIAAALLEGSMEMLTRLGDDDDRADALLESCDDGLITARGLRQVATADLLALLAEPGRVQLE